MNGEPASAAARRARREARQRAVRRRRALALTCIATLAVLIATLSLRAVVQDEPTRAATDSAPTTPSARSGTPTAGAPARSTSSATRSRLGSRKAVTFAFAGDIHFESPIREKLAASPASVLRPIAPILRLADIAVVNLETAVTDRGTPASKAYVFRAPARALDALKAGGVDVASVANNHGMDFGTVGLGDTLKAGRARGVPVIGAGWNDKQAYAPHRVTVKGQRIAIIGATQVLDDHLISAWTAAPGKMGLASAKDEPRLIRAVREARKSSDTVVVFLHWGLELSGCPTSFQTSLADKLTSAGADIVVGSHAHVLVGAGMKRKALVAYGLGNFVFYASRASTIESGVLEVTATGRRIDGYRWVPARISGGIPYPLSGGSRTQAVSSWKRLRSCTDLRP